MFIINIISILAYIVTFNLIFAYNVEEYEKLVYKISNDPKYQADFVENIDYLTSLDANYFDFQLDADFECDLNESNETATSVHALRPSDINVVAALGDSITAAFGARAKTPLGLIIENRGMSWSIGGSKTLKEIASLPNILKKFNSKILGYSTLATLGLTKSEKLNVAKSGSIADDMPGQARLLVKKMKNTKTIDYENDWKLVTLFIGGNDLCQYCDESNLKVHYPENYIASIQEALDILQKEMPRTLVNLVNIVNVKDIKDMNRGLVCKVLHQFVCKCAAYPKSEKDTEQLEEYFRNYTRLTKDLVDSERYNKKEDFTVVYQPFFRDFLPPRLDNGKVDLSYFAPDCFHFSVKSHALSAVGLWNNMLQPVGKKATTLTIGDKIMCPSKEHPYIFTSKNSF